MPLPAPYEQPHNSAFLEQTILHSSVVREAESSTSRLWRALQVLLVPWARESRSRRHSLSRHLSTRRDQVPDVKEPFDISGEGDACLTPGRQATSSQVSANSLLDSTRRAFTYRMTYRSSRHVPGPETGLLPSVLPGKRETASAATVSGA